MFDVQVFIVFADVGIYCLLPQVFTVCCHRYLLCCHGYLLCCHRYLLCCHGYLLCCHRYLLCLLPQVFTVFVVTGIYCVCCHMYLLCCHRYLLCCHRYLLCGELVQEQPVCIRHRGRDWLSRAQGPILLHLSQVGQPSSSSGFSLHLVLLFTPCPPLYTLSSWMPKQYLWF